MKNIPSDIVELLNKYSDTKQNGSILKEYLTRVSDSEPIIPVLGMQGVGKSTLINGILEENILPNEADETTCVPVEIKYGETGYADVCFKDSSESKVVHTIEELRDYVDNNFNPGNEKGISKIVLYRKKDILKSGIVIVDLPGVGSMTTSNEKTTNNYIQNLCTAIFVLPISPTIRNYEAVFIKAVWSQFSKAIFVENLWNESKEDVEDSVKYNSDKLKIIAGSINNKFENDIIVVNAYNAMKGSLLKDLELRSSSNIDSLVSAINSFAQSWNEQQTEGAKSKTIMTIDAAIKYARNILREFSLSREEIIRQREAELNEMQNSTNKLEEEIAKIKSYIGQQEFAIRSSARKKATECAHKLRAAMNKTIDSGVYDGDALTKVFNDEQGEKVTECLNSLFDEMTKIKIEVDEKIQDMCQITLENDMDLKHEEIHKKHKFRYEKGVDVIFKLGGAVSGAIVGLKVGATVGGPAGAVVGTVVGAIIGFIGHGVGSLTKREVGKNRAAETKRELEPFYDKIESMIKKTVSEKFKEYSESVKTLLDSIIRERRKQETAKMNNLYVFEDEDKANEIENDINILSGYKTSI